MKCLVLHEYLCAQKDNEMTIWDSLVFLVSKLIVDENVKIIEIEAISKLFEDKYGYKIPLHPMKTILAKMLEIELIYEGTPIHPNFSNISEFLRKNNTKPVDLSIIVNNLWSFIKEKTKKEITIDETEVQFLTYLKLNQYEIICAIVNDNEFEKDFSDNDEIQFSINEFVFEKLSSSYENKALLIDLLIANINLSSIFFEIEDEIKSDCKIYLDTRIIFRLLNVEGRYKKDEYEQFITLLKEKGYSLSIFQGHYDEIESNIQESIEYAKDRVNFKSDKASPLSSYFYYELKEQSKMELFKYDLEQALQKYEIAIDDFDYENEGNNKYNINENELYSCVEAEYGISRTEEKSNDKIWTDIKAISNIYRMRQGKTVGDINSVNFMFLTNNSALSHANRNYRCKENEKYNKFQECLTDTFLGSYLWIKSNHENDFIKKRLLSASYEYIQAKPEVKKAFLEKLEKQKDKIGEKKYLWLRSQVGVDSRKLASKTCNIVDKVLDSTPEELLSEHDNEIRNQVQSEADKQISQISKLYDSEKSRNDNIQSRLTEQEAEREETIKSIVEDSERKAKKISVAIGILFGLVLITDYILKIKTDISLWIVIPVGFFMLIITAISLYSGFTVKGFTRKLKETFIRRTCRKFKIKYNQKK